MASSRSIGFPLAAVLLAVLVLGNECAGVSAKRQTRKEKSQADEPTEATDRRKPPKPTDLKVEVSCDNVYNATWDYDFESDYKGFNATLCSKDECNTTHIDYKDREFSRKLPSPDSRYNFTLYAYNDKGRRSDPAEADFTSFPTLPAVEGLNVMPTSPSELQVIWVSEWEHYIRLSACSQTVSCVNATVLAQSLIYTFKGLEANTTYEVTAQTVVTVNNRTCEGDAAKESGRTLYLDPPKNMVVKVFCNNTLKASWTYDEPWLISGFKASLCDGDGSQCRNETYDSRVRDLSYELLDQNSSYTLYLYAFFSESLSEPAKESFDSFPNIPPVEGLNVEPTSATELSTQAYTFDGLVPNTTYEVTANMAVTMNNQTCDGDIAKKSGTTLQLDPPKDLQVKVFCNNTLKAKWEYSEDFHISGFVASLCKEDGSQCRNITYSFDVRELSYEELNQNSSYTLYLYAVVSESLSKPATASFASFPNLPRVQGLTVVSTSPTELHVLWLSEWKQDIQLSACSKTAPCVNATVPARNQTHTFKGLEPSTTLDYAVKKLILLQPVAEIRPNLSLQNPPTNLMVDVSCGNQAQVNWTYNNTDSIDGFLVVLCHGEEAKCENKTLPKDKMECSFKLPDFNATYNVSVRSFHENLQPKNKTYSKPVEESLTSFPELPELDDIAVTGVSETALMATWTTKWDGEIAFYICSMPEECQNHTILGTPRNYTFDGLASNTTYRVRAQSQVTLHEKECRGHLQERSASTFTK
ncbi:hypothetical protein MTO96_030767, partial [Rhipicephalus appendiculatus]